MKFNIFKKKDESVLIDFKFAYISESGYMHFPFCFLAFGKNGFSICIIGLIITIRLFPLGYFKASKFRRLQLFTHFHCIHHIKYGNGIKLPFVELAWFKREKAFRSIGGNVYLGPNWVKSKWYHNCTLTGQY